MSVKSVWWTHCTPLLSLTLLVQGCNVSSFKLALVGVFIP